MTRKLQSNTTISYKTRQIKRLLEGRLGVENKQPIIGLIRFGQVATDIYKAAIKDNPYAHHYLLRIETSISTVSKYIETKNPELNSLQRQGVEIGDVVTGNPREIAARFSSPFGYQAAYILHDADKYVSRLINFGHVGLIPPKEKNILLQECGKKLRGMFESVAGWKLFQVTSVDFEQDTDLNKRASSHFKFVIDPQILTGNMRAEYAPIAFEDQSKEDSKAPDEAVA